MNNELNNNGLWEIGKKYFILQKKLEFLQLIDFIKRNVGTREMLEIGTNAGGTSSVFCKLFHDVYSIDIEKHPYSVNLETEFPNFHRIIGDSRTIQVYSEIPYILHYHTLFPFIFVDGCHYDVAEDYKYCLPLLADGGYMAFHDILQAGEILGQRCEVKEFWEELKKKKQKSYNFWEIIDKESPADSIESLNELNPADWGGIGILQAK